MTDSPISPLRRRMIDDMTIPVNAANASTLPQRLARVWKPNSSGRHHSDP